MEANTSQRKWFVPCCYDEECPKCNGTGKQYLERCPVHYYTNEVRTLRYLYDAYNNKNILPFSGSPLDQPKVLFNCFDSIDHYLSVFHSIKESQRQENKAFSDMINAKSKG